jgi:protein-S-isoprenylcysteine O-methyltransferase Ste14
MIPIILFPLPWLKPLHNYAPLIWFAGVVFIGLTRFTHQFAKRWKKLFAFFSTFFRPAGIILIVVGWLAVNATEQAFSIFDTDVYTLLIYFGWKSGPQMFFWINLFFIIGLILSYAFGIWAMATLGAHRSFLYRKYEDSLITKGPYGIVRHPQFLSAIGITFFSSALSPGAALSLASKQILIPITLLTNWILFSITLWILAVIEDKELQKHFGEKYLEYAAIVPRLFPN